MMYPASSAGLNIETQEAVFFFTPNFYPLDNFSAHQVKIWGFIFPTAEHAFQWRKFKQSRPDVAEQIKHAGSPNAVKQISEAHESDKPTCWHKERVKVMREILRAKVTQHADFREALARTGRRRIIENSPDDEFWGIGLSRRGENMLGQQLMEIRDGIRHN